MRPQNWRSTAPVLIVVIILLSILFNADAFADYHYASHTGSDEYPYTSWETAADSIQPAIDTAEPGDTIYIGSGEYEEVIVMDAADSVMAFIGKGIDSTWIYTHQQMAHLVTSAHKSCWKDIHFSDFGEYSCIDAYGDVTFENCLFSNTGWLANTILVDASHVIVRNCIFEDLGGGGIVEFSINQSLEVSNCLFKNMNTEPLDMWSRHAVIKNNIILNVCGYPAFYFHYLSGYSFISISNNAIYNVCGGGIWITQIGDSTSQLANNTVDSATAYIYWDPSVTVGPNFNWRIHNNSITNSDAGVRLQSDYLLSVHYCNLWRNLNDFWVPSGFYGEFDTTYGLLHVDPMFVDSTDFHLQAFSPLIDAGDPSVLDVDGTRSDIGAYGGPGGSSYGYQDLPPRIPDSLACRVWNDTIYLDWRANYEADFFGYLLYRDTLSGFTPSDFNLIAEPDSSAFEDGGVVLGETYYYRIASLDNQGNRSEYSPELPVEVTGAWDGEGAEMPRMTVIEANYPNPFNSATTIVYSVANLGPIPAQITIEIFDIMGRKVRTLVNERKEAGIYRVIWDGRGDNNEAMSAGVYFARISQWGIGFMNKPRKLVLLK